MSRKKVTNSQKISKLSSDIEQLEKLVAENTAKLKILKETKTEAENEEIISIIRSADLSVDDVSELISAFMQPKPKNPVDTAVKGNDLK